MRKKHSVVAKPSLFNDPTTLENEYKNETNRFQNSYNAQKKMSEELDKVIRGDGKIENKTHNDGWTNVLTGLGVCGRDKKQNANFLLTQIFNRSELDQLYRSDGIFRRVIDLFAEEMMRQGYEIDGDQEDKLVNKLDELQTNWALTNLIKWARVYGGAICIMGIADGMPLDQPVDEFAIREVQWLRVFDRYQAYSRDGTFESDLNSPNYGFPNVYTVNDNRTGAVFFVHYSRILRMDWNPLPPRWQNFNQGWGDPLIQTMYEQLRNYSTAFSNTATIFEDFVNSVLSVPDLAAIMASSCGDQTVLKRLNIMNLTKSVMNTVIMDANETYTKHTTNVAGLSDLLDRFMVDLSAVTRIPISLLFGKSSTGLNATGDNEVRNFYDAIKQDQNTKLKPVLEKLVRYIILSKDGPFGGVEPENWAINFVPLWQNTQEEDALTRKLIAETDSMYIDRGVLDPSEVAISRFGGNKWSASTEIDLEARKQTEPLPGETEELLEEKHKVQQVQPSEGPDTIPTGISVGRTQL